MAGCTEWSEAITRLVDDELADSERRALKLHLDGCGRCREDVAARRQARAFWREAVSLPSDASDRAAIVARARSHLRRDPWWRRSARVRSWENLLAGASLVAIVILVVLLSQWRVDPRSAWAPSCPARYYVGERTDLDGGDLPRPF